MAQYEGTGTSGRVVTNFTAEQIKKGEYLGETFQSGNPKLTAAQIKDTIADAAKGLVQDAERVSLSKNQHFFFPTDLRNGASQGFPFMRFCVKEPGEDGNKSVVYLYHPPGVSVGDGANYGTFDMGSLKGGIDFAKRALGGNINVTKDDVYAAGLISTDKMSKASGLDIRRKSAISAGVAVNPYTRQTFEGVNIRTFSFSFKMVAESASESNMARNIERTFRKFLYPKRMGEIALAYPPLFYISFYSEGRINEYMPVIKPSYLTGMEASFNETANTMFKGTGAPIEVALSLTFTEEKALVRQDLYPTDDDIHERREGYYLDGKSEATKTPPKQEDTKD